MLTTQLINPEIISALAHCGHGSKVLIADGNYPLYQKSGEAKKVYLSLCPGSPTVTEVLSALMSVCNFEKAELMTPSGGEKPEIFAEFRELLGPNVPFESLSRYDFYDACTDDPMLALAISTGEKRLYANILLTVGCA